MRWIPSTSLRTVYRWTLAVTGYLYLKMWRWTKVTPLIYNRVSIYRSGGYTHIPMSQSRDSEITDASYRASVDCVPHWRRRQGREEHIVFSLEAKRAEIDCMTCLTGDSRVLAASQTILCGAQGAASRERTRLDTGFLYQNGSHVQAACFLERNTVVERKWWCFTVNWMNLWSFVMIRTICESEVCGSASTGTMPVTTRRHSNCTCGHLAFTLTCTHPRK